MQQSSCRGVFIRGKGNVRKKGKRSRRLALRTAAEGKREAGGRRRGRNRGTGREAEKQIKRWEGVGPTFEREHSKCEEEVLLVSVAEDIAC